jgi:hypothetical protein
MKVMTSFEEVARKWYMEALVVARGEPSAQKERYWDWNKTYISASDSNEESLSYDIKQTAF